MEFHPRRAVFPQIEVTFDTDANGILHVSAKDLAPARKENFHHRQLPVFPRTKWQRCSAKPKRTPKRTRKAKESHRDQEQRRHARVSEREAVERARRQNLGRQTQASRGPPSRPFRDAINRNDVDAMKRTYDDLQNKFQEVSASLQTSVSAGRSASRAATGPEAQQAAAQKRAQVSATAATSSMLSSKVVTRTRRNNEAICRRLRKFSSRRHNNNQRSNNNNLCTLM